MKSLICLFALLCFISCDSSDQTGPDNYNSEFFSLYKTKGIDVSLDYLFATNKWISVNDLSTVKSKLKELTPQLGKYYSNEFITKKTAGKNFVLYSYIVKYERQPIRFTLTYYRGDNKWQLQFFEFDLDLQTELREAAVPYRLYENFNE